MTISSLDTIETTLFQDAQPAGSITPADARQAFDSLAGLYTSSQASSYTFVLADRGTMVEYNSASAGTFTIPTNASVQYDINTIISFRQVGAGQLTLAAPGGGTLNTPTSLTTRAQWSEGKIHKRATDTWVIAGDLT